MNYQYPLLNLISRGHLCVKNRIAMECFIKELDNDSCHTILESLMHISDVGECARKLDEIKESYQLRFGTRNMVSESTLALARDKILVRESDGNDNGAELTNQIWKAIKAGSFIYVTQKFLTMNQAEKELVENNIHQLCEKAYGTVKANIIMKRILPKHDGFFTRLGKTIGTFDKSNLNVVDKNYLGKVGNNVGMAALIAGGLIGAIVAINVAYKRWFSTAARACSGLSGKKRTICMCEAIIAASEKAKEKAENALLECDSARNPQQCRYKMKVEIRSWMKKIAEQQRKLAKLKAVNNKAYKDEDKSEDTSTGGSNDPFL